MFLGLIAQNVQVAMTFWRAIGALPSHGNENEENRVSQEC